MEIVFIDFSEGGCYLVKPVGYRGRFLMVQGEGKGVCDGNDSKHKGNDLHGYFELKLNNMKRK